MAGNNLSLAIVVQLLTDNFTKGASRVKSTLLTMQRNFVAFTAAVGAGTVGLGNFLSRMIEVSKETSRASIALKNVSGSTAAFAENQKWLLDLSKRYGVEINSLTSGYAKFKAAADISNMSLEDQRKIFESVSRATVAFGLSAEDQRGVFMALSQMMSKNKIMAEELRLQLAERMPVAIQAMAKAVGKDVNELDALMKQGKVMSSEVLPKFADALNELIAAPDLDNLNKSLVDLSNAFQQLVEKLGVGDLFKQGVELATKALTYLGEHTKAIMGTIKALLIATFVKGAASIFKGFAENYNGAVTAAVKSVEKGAASAQRAQEAMADLEVAQARVIKAEGAYNRAIEKRDKLLKRQSELSVNATVKRQRIEENLSIAIGQIKKKELALHRAVEGEKVAASKLAAVEQTAAAQASAEQQALAAQASATGWTKAMNAVKFSVSSLFKNLKAMLAANLWTAAITGALTLAAKLFQAAKSAKEVKNAVKDIGNWEATNEMRELDSAREYLNSGDANVRAGALSKINSLLGTQLTFEDDINKAVDQRIKLLAAEEKAREAKADYEDAKAYQESFKSEADRNAKAGDVEALRKAYEEAQADLLRISGGQTTTSNTPTTTPSNKPVKVEVVNLELEDIGEEVDPNWVADVGEEIKKGSNRLIAQNIAQSIAIRKRDTSGDWKLSPTEILEADAIFAQEKVDQLTRYAQELGVELGDALTEAMANANNLGEALRIAEIQDALAEAQNSLRDITLGGIEDAVSDIDSIVNAFGRLNQAVEEDASVWEKLIATFDLFAGTIQAVISIMETIAQARAAAAQAEKVAAMTTAGANTAEAASTVGKDVAKQAPGFAALIAVPAAISAILAAFAMIPKFANGGIVSGGPKQGDKILARLNAGEAVLTPTGLESLHDAANPRNQRNIRITGQLVGRGRDLQAILDTETRFRKRIG
ncbi:MAG: tape measure protein [Alistipes sp.]|nr:tape measure protein [Alistipes sp.]